MLTGVDFIQYYKKHIANIVIVSTSMIIVISYYSIQLVLVCSL